MIRFTIFYLSLFAFNITFAQTNMDQIELKGVLVDGKDRTPLSYVNIGILNKSVGTISDATGRFSLNLKAENLTDTLQISRIGYHTIKVIVDQFVSNVNKEIALSPRDYILDEVKVVVNKETTEVVGRTKAGGFIQIAMHPKKQIVLGTEIGMSFQPEKFPAVIKDFSWFFSANNFSKIKLRVNIYSLKNNFPDKQLLNTDLYVDVVDLKTGWIKVDLEQYNVVVETDFAISIQWLEHTIKEGENPKVFIPGAMSSGHASYFRIASQDRWTKTKMNLCYFVTLLH